MEKRNVSDADYQRYTESVLHLIADADKAVDAILKDIAAAQGGAQVRVGGASGMPGTPGKGSGGKKGGGGGKKGKGGDEGGKEGGAGGGAGKKRPHADSDSD